MGKNKTNNWMNSTSRHYKAPVSLDGCQATAPIVSLSSTLFYSSTQPENQPGVLLSEGFFITSGMGVVLTALKTESRVSGRRRGQV